MTTQTDGPKFTPGMTASEKADAVEEQMMQDLNVRIAKSALYTLGEVDPTHPERGAWEWQDPPDAKRALIGDDPRLPKMPKEPTLLDFFTYRFGSSNHLLQSATHALKAGCDEKIVLACLLHDIGVTGFIRADHGYWGAQLVEPYVDEEVSWAIRYHQALRFYPDESVGYKYPDSYIKLFGPDYKPEPYIERDYQDARNHKWYMSARLICVNDLYAFDPNVQVELEEFEDVVGRHFRQPSEGLGFDASPAAHMWRTIMWPTKYL
jgi:hypothetical protein